MRGFTPLRTPLPQVISTRTGVVVTWSLRENHPTLWLIVNSGKNCFVFLITPRYGQCSGS